MEFIRFPFAFSPTQGGFCKQVLGGLPKVADSLVARVSEAAFTALDSFQNRVKVQPDTTRTIDPDQFSPSEVPPESIPVRFLDAVLGVVGLGVFVITCPLISALIVQEDGGKVFFLQDRVGLDEKVFKVWKYRTMTVMETRGSVTPVQVGDNRITKIGFWLRKMKVDELPQFLNVLLGDMRVIGPRPYPIDAWEALKPHLSHPEYRHGFRKPGLTGWGQVNVGRGDPKINYPYDLYGIRYADFALHCEIVARTLRVILVGQDVVL